MGHAHLCDGKEAGVPIILFATGVVANAILRR